MMLENKSLIINQEIVEKILQFRKRRNWAQFDNPKDVAFSLSLVAADLLECFLLSGSDSEVTEKRVAM